MMQEDQDEQEREEELRRIAEQRRQAYRASVRGPAVHSSMGGAQQHAANAAAQHFGAQHNAVAGVNNAIANEMESRVRQQRERRAIEAQMQVARMAAEARRKSEETALIRQLLGEMG